MEPAAVGIRLASAVVAPLVRRLFRSEGPGAGLVERPVRMAALVSFRGERRELDEGDLRTLADTLVRRALRGTDGEGHRETPVPADEAAPVADALARSLAALGDLDLDDVQAVQLGPEALARRLRRAAARDAAARGGGDPVRDLSADAAAFHDALLDTACLHILHFFSQRSTFVARTLVEQSRRQADQIARLDALLARTPLPAARDAAFEREYFAYVAKKHGKLTIYGVDLADSPAKWPLDVAYLRLEASAEHHAGNSPEALFPTDEYAESDPLPAPALPADQALATHDRVLLRGAAGSGKTTLVQWLALSATRADTRAESREASTMDYLAGRVPFVLPLRTLTRHGQRLPAPRDFLSATGSPLAGAQPDGWEHRVLTARRGLLLVDGIDEVPRAERDRARRWLSDLIDAYPGNRWLVTSRPSAVGEDWLAAEGFTELTLAPMRPADLARFIARWHAAVRTGAPAADDAQLTAYEQQLTAAVRHTSDLGRLATNPLMCGLMCALNRARRGHLPRGRKELYEAALSMLLTRRDRERDMAVPDLREEPQLQVLQRLAYWLIRNGRTELDRARAESLVAAALPAVPEVAALGDAGAVLEHFRDRSGLLREPGPGAVDFVHRTFQDYLGARAAVEEGDIGVLAAHAADDQWEDVIRMAVAQSRPREREEILRELLAAAKAREGVEGVRIRLLATACLEHATELAPAVREAVERETKALVPPRTVVEARALGAAGPLVLDLLPGPEETDDATTTLVAIAATYVESDRAIPFLARYATHPSLDVRRQLVWAWQRFDTEEYADDVIARLDVDELYFTVTSDAELRALRRLGGRPGIDVRGGPLDPSALHDGLAATRLTKLIIRGQHGLRDLDFLGGQRELRELRLTECLGLRDASALSGLPLRSLILDKVPELAAGVPELLASLPQVEHLSLSPDRRRPLDLDALPELPALKTLNLLTGHTANLRPLARHPELANVYLGWRHAAAADDWPALAALPRLDGLRSRPDLLAVASDDAALPGVLFLGLVNDRPVDARDLARLPELFPRLSRLVLDMPRGDRPLDLSPLAGHGSLRHVTLREHTRDLHAGLPPHVEVSYLAD
ncbi:NACHT domain-containing protein [Streptomyces sp. WMMC500]|uniref:NACHT domain-containing protein n=1 Tax=Streptomyces sp. WMMC500 TaxID=3015154 RepID=UPI00248CF0B8|nr:NACHT domain-containing protein [Streptomyces sp. WMMC500]WBB64317.1 NACHT domain-containing protein [Streptomyces sp. WMMC500]